MDAGNQLPFIKFLTGPLAGRTFVISKPITTIGRDPSNDIAVVNDQRVSRYHARLLWQSGNWSIENLSQRAALTVDQRRAQQAIIGDNTVIGLGVDTCFVFFLQRETPAKESSTTEAATAIRPPGGREDRPAHRSPNDGSIGAASAEGGDSYPLERVTQVPSTSKTSIPPLQSSGSQPLPGTERVFPAPPPALSTTAPLGGAVVPALRPDQTQIASVTALGLPSLVVSGNAYTDEKAFILDKPIINVGRDATNDMIINDRIVSGLHLRIVRRGNAFILI
ncbi:MAG TPA: FHA domain-containing protein, partial [Ktedonobacteraceae bacterium]|nr:FHA domain-containing protein [Ktedonobacteraceae bacterium]